MKKTTQKKKVKAEGKTPREKLTAALALLMAGLMILPVFAQIFA